ncbi:protein MOS2-like protein [Corchorus olitorius]|uniref:Protein MOS2-like protein n=1 Tax=Corchorus olitorius TaxID=93759 RepID=A0A1R3KGX6_9ROSI|nr:protein MOS2-like protein [Corchorus olitorius]
MKNLDLPPLHSNGFRDLQFESDSSSYDLPNSNISYALNACAPKPDSHGNHGCPKSAAAPVETVILLSLKEDLKTVFLRGYIKPGFKGRREVLEEIEGV